MTSRLARLLGRGTPEKDTGYWLRTAYFRMKQSSVTDASRAARAWAEWAAAEVDAGRTERLGEAADAYQELIGQFIRELSRRTGPEQIRVHAARMQGVAAEAGFWLARAGRVREAVSAVEAARAVLLSSRLQRLPDDLEERLAGVGRADLFEEYRTAERRLDQFERRGYVPRPGLGPDGEPGPEGGLGADGGPGADLVLTPERQAWSRFHVLRREVELVLAGSGTIDLAAMVTEEIPWRAEDGQLVYLAASRGGGYALVSDGAPEPRWLSLPQLTVAASESAVGDLRHLLAEQSEDEEAWLALLGRLGQDVMGPILDEVDHHRDVVLVPLGGLSVLPLHAAVLPEAGSEPRYADEVALLRYAPNARLAGAASRLAVPGPPSTVMVVGVNRPAGTAAVEELLYAEREAALVCAIVPDRGRRPEPPTLATVLGEMDTADVWHFACHGIADSADPLDSAVLLADQPLRVRQLMSRPSGRHRLAVLSACQTNVPDPQRIDEAIGFPGALMRAGICGVIATQWSVDDATAVLLMRKFYELWLAGREPPQALSQAQSWFRRATLAEVTGLMPARHDGGGLAPPPGPPQGRWAQPPYARKPWTWAAFSYTGA